MEVISKDELKLLAYLHENVKGFGQPFGLPAPEVRDGLDTDDDQLQKNASFLKGLGFVGTEGYQAYANPNTDSNFGSEGRLLEIHLTSTGEKFCRALERALTEEMAKTPTKAKKITAKVVEFVYDAGKAVIVKTLTDWVSGHH